MLEAGDRVAVGVSGGKDSRTLLALLLQGVDIPPGDTDTQKQAQSDALPPDENPPATRPYDIVAVHIDGSRVGLPDQRPVLEPWFQELGVAYEITPLLVPEGEALPMKCFRCTWNRRKALFFAADRLECNKVAMGHHADDAAVTTLMSLMYKGQLETLQPSLNFFDGRFIVIRPLIYLTASEIARYARKRGWQFPPELECPRLETARRVHIERFLRSLSNKEYKQIRTNLWRAAREVMGF